MSIGGIGSSPRSDVQALLDMRRQLDDLQRQLGTGKKSSTYAGLGIDRSLVTSLRSQLSGLDGFGQSMTLVGVRLDVAQSVLSRAIDIRSSVKSALAQAGEVKSSGQSTAQEGARSQLDELMSLLNAQAGDRYLFGGRVSDQPPVESASAILDGDGTRAGLKQIIAERALADLGASGLGRLTATRLASTVTLAEDAAGSPFGFKLNAVASSLTGVTAAGPTGSPPAISVDFTANPNAGESIALTLDLPDGTKVSVTLKATTANPPGAGEFTIGATPADTASNFQSALTGALGQRADTALAAASARAAAEDFFNMGAGDPPLRVNGPPFDTATALVAGTPANTVSWYKGEMASDPARQSAVARIDTSITVSYGMRADEQAIRSLVQNIATFAAVSFDPADNSTPARYQALSDRLAPALGSGAASQRIEDIVADLGNAQATIGATQERHRQTNNVLGGLLDQTEGVPTEQVATEILALQTRLQASLQVTSMLYQTRLTDYL